MNVNGLIDAMEDIIANAQKAPLWMNGYLMDQEQLLNLIDDLRSTLPSELEDAARIVDQQDALIADATAQAEEIRANAQKEADEIIANAQAAAESRVDDSEIMKEAGERATDMLTRAQSAAAEIRKSADQYVEDILSDMEVYIQHQLDTVHKNRGQMQGR